MMCLRCLRRQILRKLWPIHLNFLLLIVRRKLISSSAVCNSSNFSHDRSKWPSVSFSSTTFQNFVVFSALISEVSKFQHRQQLFFQMQHFTSFLFKFKSSRGMYFFFLLMQGVTEGMCTACRRRKIVDIFVRTHKENCASKEKLNLHAPVYFNRLQFNSYIIYTE
jgi:hypothetical protein